MTRATRGRSLKVPGATGTTRQAGRRPGLPVRAGGDQLTATGRNEPAGGCLSARPLRLMIPSSRCGGPAPPEPVPLDRQMIDGLLGAIRDGLSGALGLASPGPLRDLPRDVGGGAAANVPCARCRPRSRAGSRRGRRVESGDRWAVVHQRERRRLPSSEGIPKAWRHFANLAGQRAARPPGLRISGIRSLPGQCAADCGSRRPGTTCPTPWS
jgi:hypothetical protein